MTMKTMVKSSPLLARVAWPVYREVLLQRSRHPSKGPIPMFSENTRLVPIKLKTFDDYLFWSQSCAAALDHQEKIELSLSPSHLGAFSIPGMCALCGSETTFKSNFDYAIMSEGGRLLPHFREHLVCAHCGLKNRVRAALHLFIQEFRPSRHQEIYITEQLGAGFRWLKGRGYAVSGSEYIPNSTRVGTSWRGIRNEDLAALTWPNDLFDFLLSFDVLEHVPYVDACFSEILRCLKPGGDFLFTAPFRPGLRETLVRAIADRSGEVTHLMSPEYHGGNVTDPAKGTLCFRNFGWDTIQQLERAGFSDAEAWLFWSRELGYFGGTQIVVWAHKK